MERPRDRAHGWRRQQVRGRRSTSHLCSEHRYACGRPNPHRRAQRRHLPAEHRQHWQGEAGRRAGSAPPRRPSRQARSVAAPASSAPRFGRTVWCRRFDRWIGPHSPLGGRVRCRPHAGATPWWPGATLRESPAFLGCERRSLPRFHGVFDASHGTTHASRSVASERDNGVAGGNLVGWGCAGSRCVYTERQAHNVHTTGAA